MEGAVGDLFIQLGIVIIITAIVSYLFRLIKQPLILAYILVGIIITPILGIVTDTSLIESMSMVGIAFLLFIVGIEIDLKKLKTVALVSTFGGGIQVALLFLFGYLIAYLLGFLHIEAAYIGIMLAFSSTMIAMKFLSDKKELNTLHGRLVIGILLLEDIIAIIILSVLSSASNFSFSVLGLVILKLISLFALAFLCSKFLFPRLFKFAAENPELLLVLSLSVCFIFSLAFYYLGLSLAIGAFLAGVTLGSLSYNYEIIAKVRSLRDFFALLFFVSLGMGLSLAVIQKLILPLIVLIFFVLFFKPILLMLIYSLFKYTKRPAFLSAVTLSQIGEFSLIIAAQGLLLGHINRDIFSLIVIVVLISIILSSYLTKYDNWLYKVLDKPLKIFEIFTTKGMEYAPTEIKPSIILCGHNRIGYSILNSLKKQKKSVLIIDYNPEMIDMLAKNGFHCIYGDVVDEEIIEKMNLEEIKMLISTVPETKDNLHLIHRVKRVNSSARVIVTASEIDEALKLYKAGADYVIMPHFLGGEHAAKLILEAKDNKKNLFQEKKCHIAHLNERKIMGHEHPKI